MFWSNEVDFVFCTELFFQRLVINIIINVTGNNYYIQYIFLNIIRVPYVQGVAIQKIKAETFNTIFPVPSYSKKE